MPAEDKKEFSKLLVAAIILMNVAFTVAVLWIFLRVGNEPSALIVAWFAFTTGELFFLAGIKKKKLDKGGGGGADSGPQSRI